MAKRERIALGLARLSVMNHLNGQCDAEVAIGLCGAEAKIFMSRSGEEAMDQQRACHFGSCPVKIDHALLMLTKIDGQTTLCRT